MKFLVLTIYTLNNGNVISSIFDETNLYKIDPSLGELAIDGSLESELTHRLEDGLGYTKVYVIDNVDYEPGFTTDISDDFPLGSNKRYFAFVNAGDDFVIGGALEKAMRSIGWRKCDECGSWIEPQEIWLGHSVYDRAGGKRYCSNCKGKMPLWIELGRYHSSVGRTRVMNADGEDYSLTNVKGLGIELEVNNECCCSPRVANRERMQTVNRNFYEIASKECDDSKRVFFCERDCSVAAEIISNVFTEKAWNAFDFSILTDQARFVDNDENFASVGLHYHLSNTWLGDTAKARVASYAKILYFVNAYQADFERLSKRVGHETSYRDAFYYCSFASKETILERAQHANRLIANNCNEKTVLESFYQFHGSDGCAIINSGKTIEFRIFHSTNDPERIKQTGKFLMGLCQGLAKVSFARCLSLGKAFKYVPDDTKVWLRSQGLFLKSLAVPENGGRTGMTEEEIANAGF